MYREQYEVVPSIQPCRYHDEFMAKLHNELDQWPGKGWAFGCTRSSPVPVQGGGALGSTLHPELGHRRKEIAKWLRGDSLMRGSWPYSRHRRSKAWQHQSQLPGCQQPSKAPPQASMKRPHRCTSLSPSPLHPHYTDE